MLMWDYIISGGTESPLRVLRRINFSSRSTSQFFLLRAATQRIFTRVAWTSDHSVMYHQVSVASQSEGIARRFYFTGLADHKLDHLVWDRTDCLVSIVGSQMDVSLIV